MTNKYILSKIFRLAWLFAIIGALLPCRAQSTAETAEGIKMELDGIKTEFVSTLQSAASNPENLQSGQTKANCEQILAKLESLQSRINSTVDMLVKKETDLATKPGLSKADKLELQQMLQNQRAPIDASKKTAAQLQAELKSLKASKIRSIQDIYKNYFDIAGPEKAKAKVEANIQSVLTPYLSAQPKPSPIPYASPTPASRMKDDMVFVEGGTLPVASELSGKPVKSFYIGRTEVTWLEWKDARGWASDHGYDIGNVGKGSLNEHPVRDVNWYDCLKWCNARSEMDGLKPVYQVNGAVYRSGEYGANGSHLVTQLAGANGYRLPSEAEWEWAARGGVKSRSYKYSGSDDLNSVGWYSENSKGVSVEDYGTFPVGKKGGNELDLRDMSGNVWEWCWDLIGSGRRYRGGCWFFSAGYCAVSYRVSGDPDARIYGLGLRLARSSEF